MVIASSEWDPVWRRQECWSIVSNAPSEGEIRLARVSMGACRVTRAEKGLGTWAIDPERTPILAVQIPSHQVPAITGVHQPMWLNQTGAGRSGAIVVDEPNSVVVPAVGGENRQALSVDGWRTCLEGKHEPVHGRYPAAQTGGQHLFQFQQSSDRWLFEPGDTTPGRGSQSQRNGDRFVIVEEQRRQDCARPKLIAAGHSRAGVDRITQTTQAVHVPPQGSRVHF